ncbi:hypothetical protein H8959_001218 [Pygathrix nigripes]
MQPRTPLVLCVLLSQVGKRGCRARSAPRFCIQIARHGQGLFTGGGESSRSFFASRGDILAHIKWGNFGSLLRRLRALEKDSVGGDSNEPRFPTQLNAQRRKRCSSPDCGLPGWRGRAGTTDFPGRPGPLAQPGCALEGASGQQRAAAQLPLSLKGAGAGRTRIGVLLLPDPGPERAGAHPLPGRRPQPPAPLLSSQLELRPDPRLPPLLPSLGGSGA